jgi:sortase (surface protein transpeptidase)
MGSDPMVAEVSAGAARSFRVIGDHGAIAARRWPGDAPVMRKAWGRRAPWAMVGAMLLLIAGSTDALGMTPSPRSGVLAEEGRVPVPLTLGANLDRSLVAPYRELARTSAIAAAAARAHPVKHVRKAAPVRHSPVRTQTVVRNHLWIPALGISRTVVWFPCSRTTAPGNYVYRWGCAGHNNVYLLGHAGGVFQALHDAYYNGTLRKGMVAIYADRYGRITHYRLTAWQVVRPSDISWAGSLRTPSMTLQTCVGPKSAYRLDVRLVSY